MVAILSTLSNSSIERFTKVFRPRFGQSGHTTQPSIFDAFQTQIPKTVASFPTFAAPAFNAGFHQERREALIKLLPPNTTLIVAGNTQVSRNSDVVYKFRQDSNFYYLTGFDEPDALAILSNEPSKPNYTLVVPPRDQLKETWDGKRAGTAGALSTYGASAAFDTTQLDHVLTEIAQTSKNLMVLDCPTNPVLNEQIKTVTTSRPVQPTLYTGTSALELVHSLRLVKTPEELALMQRACDVSIKGHMSAIRNMKLTPHLMKKYIELKNGVNEGVIQAEVEKPFRQHGAVRVGYESINGAGANGCILHYVTNNEYAKPGDLVLVDAGAEYGYYTADITRTWPISGKFSPAQKAIYDIVLDAQESGIQMVKPGMTLKQIHKNSVEVITKGLMGLGILKGDPNDPVQVKASIEKGEFRDYFMHGTSHWMGMDVHDMQVPNHTGARAGQDEPLQPGMVFSVEPGIYISPETGKKNGLDPKWWGIGVRIEDDIACTETGFVNLSGALPRKTDEIEALMAGQSKLARTLSLTA